VLAKHHPDPIFVDIRDCTFDFITGYVTDVRSVYSDRIALVNEVSDYFVTRVVELIDTLFYPFNTIDVDVVCRVFCWFSRNVRRSFRPFDYVVTFRDVFARADVLVPIGNPFGSRLLTDSPC
jgi:hypothetical protein